MKKKILNTYRPFLLVIIMVLSTLACKKEKDEPNDKLLFKLSTNEVSMEVEEEKQVKVVSGLAPFSIPNSQSQKIVKVQITKNIITLVGLKEGKTELNIVSDDKESVKLKVEVKAKKKEARHHRIGFFPKETQQEEYLSVRAIAYTDDDYVLFQDLGSPYEQRVAMPIIDFKGKVDDVVETKVQVQGITVKGKNYDDFMDLDVKGPVVFVNREVVCVAYEDSYLTFMKK